MKSIFTAAALSVLVLSGGAAFAGEKSVTLDVENMYCAACPYIVKQTLAGVEGVSKVDVSYKDKTATVTFDDSKTDVAALTDATFEAGYPSEPKAN